MCSLKNAKLSAPVLPDHAEKLAKYDDAYCGISSQGGPSGEILPSPFAYGASPITPAPEKDLVNLQGERQTLRKTPAWCRVGSRY